MNALNGAGGAKEVFIWEVTTQLEAASLAADVRSIWVGAEPIVSSVMIGEELIDGNVAEEELVSGVLPRLEPLVSLEDRAQILGVLVGQTLEGFTKFRGIHDGGRRDKVFGGTGLSINDSWTWWQKGKTERRLQKEIVVVEDTSE